MDVGCWGRIQSFITTGRLQKCNKGKTGGRKSGARQVVACPSGSRVPVAQPQYLEEVECRVKHLLDDLLQELFEHAVLIDASLIDPQVVHKLHSNNSLHGVLRKLSELFVPILPRLEEACQSYRDTQNTLPRMQHCQARACVLQWGSSPPEWGTLASVPQMRELGRTPQYTVP